MRLMLRKWFSTHKTEAIPQIKAVDLIFQGLYQALGEAVETFLSECRRNTFCRLPPSVSAKPKEKRRVGEGCKWDSGGAAVGDVRVPEVLLPTFLA